MGTSSSVYSVENYRPNDIYMTPYSEYKWYNNMVDHNTTVPPAQGGQLYLPMCQSLNYTGFNFSTYPPTNSQNEAQWAGTTITVPSDDSQIDAFCTNGTFNCQYHYHSSDCADKIGKDIGYAIAGVAAVAAIAVTGGAAAGLLAGEGTAFAGAISGASVGVDTGMAAGAAGVYSTGAGIGSGILGGMATGLGAALAPLGAVAGGMAVVGGGLIAEGAVGAAFAVGAVAGVAGVGAGIGAGIEVGDEGGSPDNPHIGLPLVPPSDWRRTCQTKTTWSQNSGDNATGFSIPDYSTDTKPKDISMPIANVLYDSTNSAPKLNAQQDWGTTTWSDIIEVMSGVETTYYMLVPEVSENSPTSAPDSTQYTGVEFYQKEYTPPWIRNYSHSTDAPLNVQSWPSPAAQNSILTSGVSNSSIGGTLYIIPTQDDVDMFSYVQPGRLSNPYIKTPSTAKRVQYNYTSPPAPPIAVLNQKVRSQCSTYTQKECNPARQNEFLENMCNNLKTDVLCTANAQCKWGGDDTGPSSSTASPCTVKTPVATTEPKGVCYDSTANAQGMPAVHACLAEPTPTGDQQDVPISPFGAQVYCLKYTTEETCQGKTPPSQYQGYGCTWTMVETTDACAKHKTKTQCTSSSEDSQCKWDACQWTEPGKSTGSCIGSSAATAMINAEVDPMQWTIYSNYKHDPTTPMGCTPDSSDCTQQDVSVQSTGAPAPFSNPEICSSEHRASQRINVPGTTLNGIPFCAHYSDIEFEEAEEAEEDAPELTT